MKINNFFRGFNWWLFTSAIISFVLILCINLWFSNITEIFKNASIIGDINTGLLGSHLAAYIFYLITSYYQEFKNRKNSKIPLSYYLLEISNTHDNFIKTLNLAIQKKNLELEKEVKRDDLTIIKITDSPPKIHNSIEFKIPNTWRDFLLWHKNVIQKSVRTTFNLYTFVMEDELREILSQIDNSKFHEEINKAYQRPDIYQNLNTLFKPMQEYITFFERLKIYIERM